MKGSYELIFDIYIKIGSVWKKIELNSTINENLTHTSFFRLAQL